MRRLSDARLDRPPIVQGKLAMRRWFALVLLCGILGSTTPVHAGDDPLSDMLMAKRAVLGFDTSAEELLLLAGVIPSEFGVALLPSELAELQRRVQLQAEIAHVRESLEQLEGFAGLYIDHRSGGIVNVLMATGEASSARELLDEVGLQWLAVVRRVPFSLADLLGAKERVTQLPSLLQLGVVRIGVDIRANRVIMGTTGSPELVQAIIPLEVAELVEVEVADPIEAGACVSRSNCASPLKGGLGISSVQGACTSGLMMRTGSTSFATTAGHCSNNPRTGTVWKHNGSGIGTVTVNAWYTASRADAAGIDLVSNAQESNLVYRSTNSFLAVTSRQPQEGDNVGDLVCHSGISSGVQCGVLETAETVWVEGNRFDDMRRAQVPFTYGDSGSPVWSWNTSMAVGIGSSFDGSGNFWYSHIYWVEQALGLITCINATCS